jgi:subtilisin family serine protease
MKRIYCVLFLLCVIVGSVMAQPLAGNHVSGRLLVQQRRGADPKATAQVLAGNGARLEKMIPQINVSVLQVPEPASSRVAAALAKTGLFNFVESDYIAHVSATPNDPDFSSQWYLSTIQGPSAWNMGTGASGIIIADIDSGADGTHPDLASKLVPGWSFVSGTSSTSDNTGHGTAVAGTMAAATNNGTGVAGVAWANPVMPLVVIDSTGSGSYSNIASAITYATDHGARIINMSLAGSTPSSTLQSAVNYAWSKGVVIFASAGNYSTSTPYYPAACDNVVAVSATDNNDNLASFSNYGSWIDLSAPGTSILTTNSGGGYGYWDGTSFSAPIAAGVGALVLSLRPSLSNSALVSLLEQNSDDLGTPGYDIYYGYGRVNAYKALSAASNIIVDIIPPVVSISSPAAGTTVSGTIAVQGTATDNVGVTSIQFYVDGQLVTSASTSPFSFSWNTTSAANASHMLMVNASDAAGNVGSASVTVTVSNSAIVDTTPPTATITNPLNGAKVTGTVAIAVAATDDVAVAQVSIYVDGVLKCTDTVAPYTCSWNTKKVAAGSHTIAATAWDKAGNKGTATPVVVSK